MADEAPDPAAEFARLMSGAAAAAAPPADEARYGFTTDRETGEQRPKKAAGRPRKPPPGLEELKAAQPADAEAGKPPRQPDTAPDEKRKNKAADPAREPAPYTPGKIARGMNRIYRRAGKMLRPFDPALGNAFIECATTSADDDDLTVGDAYEELARVNPRVRAFLLKLISGGAWGQLAMAHAPIALVVLTKPWLLERIPFPKLAGAIASWAEPEAPAGDDEDQATENPLAGMTAGDLQQLAGLAQGLMANLGRQAGTAGRHRIAEAA